jgi:phosphoglycolate phosphatase
MKNILLDLDGTLTDSSEGITKSLQYALEKLGRPVPISEEMLCCIGPPLLHSFLEHFQVQPKSLAEQAVGFYRERYNRQGQFENRVYRGIPETLDILQTRGFSLYLATAKPEVQARSILDHFKLSSYFAGIYGSGLNGALGDKGELIGHILRHEDLSVNDTVMVGDRKYDMIGAGKCAVRKIGVTYGFGTHEELSEAGADYIVDSPEALASLLGVPGALAGH